MSKRDIRLDTMRGILLVIMTLNHLGTAITKQPFGFVSAAEGFILLSAYTYAITSQLANASFLSLVHTARKRALKIYKYHILSFAVLLGFILVVPFYGAYYKQFFVADGSVLVTVIASLLLIHQPMYFDILPMYIVFSLLSPIVLYALRSQYGSMVLLASAAFWFVGQFFDPLKLISDVSGMGNKSGYFNIFAWQLLWVFGLYLGVAHKHHDRRDIASGWVVFAVAAAIVVTCLLARYSIFSFPDEARPFFSRSKLGVLRLINVTAQLALLLILLRWIERTNGLPWFKFIGTYSLQVFTYQVFIVYLAKPLDVFVASYFGTISTIGFRLLVLASLSIPALLYRETLRNRAKAANPLVPAVPPQLP